jgi:hypothetical protein
MCKATEIDLLTLGLSATVPVNAWGPRVGYVLRRR